jgi:hypothetical protein
MKHNFFPMSRADICFIVALLTFAFVSFLPWSRHVVWSGMVMLGWMMVLLMILSPTIELLRVAAERSASKPSSREIET